MADTDTSGLPGHWPWHRWPPPWKRVARPPQRRGASERQETRREARRHGVVRREAAAETTLASRLSTSAGADAGGRRGPRRDPARSGGSHRVRAASSTEAAAPRFPSPLAASPEATSPTAIRTDVFAGAMIPTAVLWPLQCRRAALSLPAPRLWRHLPTVFRAELSAEATIPVAMSMPLPQRRAALPLPLPGEPRVGHEEVN